MPIRTAALAILLAGCGGLALAQSSGGVFRLKAHSIDGGGQRSSGGNFAVTGSVGQADAGTHAGGSFVLRGGLWPALSRNDDLLFRNGFDP